MIETKTGDVLRMKKFSNVDIDCEFNFKVGNRKKVAIFLLLGEENLDGSDPLDCEKVLNALGWFRKISPKTVRKK